MSSSTGTSPVTPVRGRGLPPGPRLPAALQTALWAIAPHRFGTACVRRYGPVFTARILGFGDVVHLADPEGVGQVLRDREGAFDAPAANASIRFVVGEHSLLMAHGDLHTSRRRILMKPLHGANVANYVALMESIVEQEMSAWPDGATVRLADSFARVTLEVMMRAVFGITDSSRLARLRTLVPELLAINPLIILFRSARREFGGIGPWARYRRLLAEVDEIVFAEIRERRAGTGPRGNDVLSLLVAAGGAAEHPLEDRELRDHMVTLLAVGQETTATQLAWYFERVLHTPGALGYVTRAVRAGDERAVDATIHEAIRVRPATLDLGRIVVPERWEHAGYSLPAGTMVAVSLGLLHASGELFDEPERFRVDRFLDRPPPRSYFLPFGAGSHRCLGASLAMTEMRTVVATILRRLDLEPAGPRAERARPRGPMLVPARGAAARVRHDHGRGSRRPGAPMPEGCPS